MQSVLRNSDTETYCPFKGDASYYHVVTAAGDTVEDAIWWYDKPYPAVAQIAGHVAFYSDKADVSVGGQERRPGSAGHSLIRCIAASASCSTGRPVRV